MFFSSLALNWFYGLRLVTDCNRGVEYKMPSRIGKVRRKDKKMFRYS